MNQSPFMTVEKREANAPHSVQKVLKTQDLDRWNLLRKFFFWMIARLDKKHQPGRQQAYLP